MDKSYFVYIITNRDHRVLYTGVTNNLLYYEQTYSVEGAITREKQIKGWKRQRKIDLIHTVNPDWDDMSSEILPPE